MPQELNALTVSQLNRQVRSWLEMELGEVTVIGELSNLSKPSSGHFYFCLKDSSAQIRCVYFRNNHDLNSKNFKDGQQVLAQGRLSLYEARGDYQLIIRSLTEAGLGELYRQFELLKAKLQAMGLFDPARKRNLPLYPSLIAVVTSSSGAALQDILTTLNRRYPLAAIKVYASEVQGKEAPQLLIRAINRANKDAQADVLILARGGGSIEDLWAFNSEHLALAISESAIPIVTGIGHETDFTIADFVADFRAATPTAAAETVTPHQFELKNKIKLLEERLFKIIIQRVQHQQLLLSHRIAKFLSPTQLINKHWQKIDHLERQLGHNMRGLIYQKQKKLHQLSASLNSQNPALGLQQVKTRLQTLEQLLIQAVRVKFNKLKQQFSTKLATLNAVSPLSTLERGYALATHDGAVLFNSTQVNTGDTIKLRLARGILTCQVIDKME